MTSSLPDPDEFDPDRILSTLHTHNVEFLVVGGIAARAHGASRPTSDFDCVPNMEKENLERLATALRSLNARLRVAGMSDEESRRLPVHVDARTLAGFGSSTWMTDAGPLDLLIELRDTGGGRHSFADLAERSVAITVGSLVIRVAALRDIVDSKAFAGRPKDLDALPELRELLALNRG